MCGKGDVVGYVAKLEFQFQDIPDKPQLRQRCTQTILINQSPPILLIGKRSFSENYANNRYTGNLIRCLEGAK